MYEQLRTLQKRRRDKLCWVSDISLLEFWTVKSIFYFLFLNLILTIYIYQNPLPG